MSDSASGLPGAETSSREPDGRAQIASDAAAVERNTFESPRPLRQTLAVLPPEWPDDPLPEIRRRLEGITVVVLDDDPTGTQTVCEVPVLTEWAADSLAPELAAAPPMLFVLTNSRAKPAAKADAIAGEIAANLAAASGRTGRCTLLVSRSDSTLRGHYPGEVLALDGGRMTRHLLAPFFLEGGRLTIDDVHYVAEGDTLVPAAATPFARDATFGYQSSDLLEWTAERFAGVGPFLPPTQSVSLETIRRGGPDAVAAQLIAAPSESVVAVNAASTRDIEVAALATLLAEEAGVSYRIRAAAGIVRALAGQSPQPPLTQIATDRASGVGGLIVVGSYVPKTTRQVASLLALPDAPQRVELDVPSLLDGSLDPASLAQTIDRHLSGGRHAALVTSRQLVATDDPDESLAIGGRVSAALIDIVRGIQTQPRFLIAKGGITSSDIATEALGVRRAIVVGQLLPGVPFWRLGDQSRLPGCPYIVFPGNVGDDDALAAAYRRLA